MGALPFPNSTAGYAAYGFLAVVTGLLTYDATIGPHLLENFLEKGLDTVFGTDFSGTAANAVIPEPVGLDTYSLPQISDSSALIASVEGQQFHFDQFRQFFGLSEEQMLLAPTATLNSYWAVDLPPIDLSQIQNPQDLNSVMGQIGYKTTNGQVFIDPDNLRAVHDFIIQNGGEVKMDFVSGSYSPQKVINLPALKL